MDRYLEANSLIFYALSTATVTAYSGRNKVYRDHKDTSDSLLMLMVTFHALPSHTFGGEMKLKEPRRQK